MINTENDLEKELEGVPQTELYKFMDWYMPELCKLVKPGNKVLVFEEGYFCSKCDFQLNDEEAWWHYCSSCAANFDCCEEDNEPCEACGPRVEELVLKAYAKIQRG